MKLHHLPWFGITATFFNVPLALLGGVLFCVAPSATQAQNVTFAGAERGITSSTTIAGIALDGNGNLFIADFHDGTVEEILAVDGSIPLAPTIKTLASGFGSGIQGSGYTGPGGIAVDANGNIFLTDPNNNAVKEIVAVDGSIPATPTIKTLGSGFAAPQGIALDAAGNVFVADTFNNAVKEILATDGYVTVRTLDNSFNEPVSVAVDGSGNVFVGDNTTVKEILAVDSNIPADPTINILARAYAYGIAVDGGGNVYFADPIGVEEILAVNGNIPADPTIQNINLGYVGEFSPITSVALDRWGNLFTVYSAYYTLNYSEIFELEKHSVDFEGVEVCPAFGCNYSLPLNFNVAAATTIGSIKVLTQGAPNLDFQPQASDTSSTLCFPQTYSSATTCTVDVTFTPLAPGQRNGAVEILDASGNVLATTYIYGTGTGPAIAFSPSPQNNLGSDFIYPAGVAVDASGNIFVADAGRTTVQEILASSGYTTTKSLGSGFSSPYGVAVDGSGNVFVADSGNNAVKEILAAGGYATVRTVGSGFNFPVDVAVDGSGNFFVTDVLNYAVKEILAVGDYSTVKTLLNADIAPWGIAVDGSENVFYADSANNQVVELLAASGYTTGQSLGSGFNGPRGLALDANGDVFVGDQGSNSVKEIPAAGGYTTVNTVVSGFTNAFGMALNGVGNLFIAGTNNTQIVELERSAPPTLNFAATPVGATSSDSPQSVHFQNIGNQPLIGTGKLSSSLDFTVEDGAGIAPDCDGVLSLDPGTACNVSLSFTPHTAGPLSSTFILSDNSLNAKSATQQIQLSGTGTLPTPQIVSISPNYGAPAAPITITGTNFGATQGSSYVTVGGALSYVSSWSNTAITILVPSRATTGNIVVNVGGASSDGLPFTFYPYPTTTGLSPLSGPIGTSVAITGTGLLDGGHNATVTFNGTPAAIISDTTTTITVDVPAGATTGPVHVRVNGIPLNEVGTFTVTSSSLSVTSISPNYGAPASPITITGTGFGATQGASYVTVGGALSYVASWSNTAITILVPSRATTGNIVVNVGGDSSNGKPFTFYPYPTSTGIAPLSGPIGTPVTITGTGLLDGGHSATVTFNGTPATILSDTSTTITVNVPVGATTGPVHLRVNGIPLNEVGTFTVTSSSLSIASIAPNYGAPAAPITITGTGFGATQGTSVVTVGGAPSYVASWSNTAITILVPSRATTGNIVVNVGGDSSNGEPFTFYPYPTTTGISPLSGPIGTPVTITGTGLLDGGHSATVTFNGTPATILSDTSTTITVNVPVGATTGPVHLRVNGIPLNEVGTFTVTSSSLSVTSINPNYGAPAAPITITGTGFGATQGTSYVNVGGALSYVVSWSNTAITILVPSRATTGNIVVNVGGDSSNGEPFTFYPYPSTTGIAPLSGPIGTPITITGTGLLDGGNAATVTFNGTPATILSDTSTTITVNVPTGATTGPIHLRVNGIPLNAVGTFSVTAGVPIISSITPASAPVGSSDLTIQVVASDILSDSVVEWNGIPLATRYVPVGPSYYPELNATLPAALLGTPSIANITVSNPGTTGGVSLPQAFPTYLALPTNTMVYNPHDGMLYASVPGYAGPGLGNTVVAIDPNTGRIAKTIPVGSEPDKLSVSDDGTQMYVTLDGPGAVRQVDLTTGTPGLQFSFGVSDSGPQDGYPILPAGIAVLPGEPDAVAVLQSSGLVRIYDSGVGREYTQTLEGGSGALAFGSSVATLYATVFGDTISQLSVNDRGVAGSRAFAAPSFAYSSMQFDNGNLYLGNGAILNATAGTQIGQFYTTGLEQAAGPLVSDSTLNRAWVQPANALTPVDLNQILAFDETSFKQIGSIVLQGTTTSGPISGSPNNLVRWGQNGLALNTSSDIYIVQSPLVKDVSGSPADLSVVVHAPAAATTGKSIPYSISVTNNGPSAAQGVSLTATLPTGVSYQGTATSIGSCNETSQVVCDLGTLSSGNIATVTVTGTALQPGPVESTAFVSSSSYDPVQINNISTAQTILSGATYAPVPALTSVSPNLILAGSSTTTLTVNGAGFSELSTVLWNGAALPTTYAGSTLLTVSLDSAYLASLGWGQISVSNPSPGGGVSQPVLVSIYQSINVPASSLIYEPYSRQLYATVPSTATNIVGNSIVQIDPLTGNIGTPTVIGNAPDVLAETADGNYLYVGLSGNTSLGQFNLLNQKLAASYPLVVPGEGSQAAVGLAVQPGSDTILAINYASEIGIFDTSGGTGTFRANLGGGVAMAFADPLHLYTEQYPNLTRYTVGSDGLTLLDSTPLNGLANTGFAFSIGQDGRVYGVGGGIINPQTTPPSMIALLPLNPSEPGFYISGDAVLADTAQHKAFIVGLNSTSETTAYLERFDTAAYINEQNYQLPMPGNPPGNSFQLVRWGQDGLAVVDYDPIFGTSAGYQLLLFKGPFVLPAEAQANPVPVLTSVSPNPIAHSAGNLNLTAAGSGFIPGAIVLWNGVARTTTYIDADHLQFAVPASDVATSKTVTLTAENPGSGPTTGFALTVQ